MAINNKERVRTSIRTLQIIIVGMVLVVVGRLYQLQILEYETYSPLSRENSLRQEYVSPARGLIYDRNGNLLVDNEPIYTITITPSTFDKEKIPLLAELMEFSEAEVRERINEAEQYSWKRSSRLFTEVDFKTFSLIQENIWRLPGIGHKIESKRNYPTPIKSSHVLGYLREVSEEFYNTHDTYRLGDKVGKSGLEKTYEEHLKGELGKKYIRVNAHGQALGSYNGGELDVPPSKGQDLITTLDTELQMMAEELMQNKNGAVVALNPNDGSVLSMVSSPQFDIRRLSGRIDQEYWNKVNSDTANILFNRAISNKQPPGSTFKPFMSLVGLELGLLTPDKEIHCDGGFTKGRRYKCTKAHGWQTMEEAIQNSCNTYFFSLMNDIATKGHINEWHDLITDFGMGRMNHIDLPYEVEGIIPDSTYLMDYFQNIYKSSYWSIGDMISLGVGQGLVSVSPLQMAVSASTIANGGTWIQPHVVRGIRQANGNIKETKPQTRQLEWIDEEQLNVVKNGMRRVVQEGSGRWYAKTDRVDIAGKTGTAQNPHGEDHAWFIAFAPVDDPQIAVAAFVENAGYGSMSSAPIASLLIEKYVTGSIEREWIYQKMLDFNPQDQEDEDEEDSSEADD